MDRCPSVVLVPIHHSASIKKKPVRRKWKWKKRKIKGENNKILNFLIWRCCCNCRSRPKEHTRYQMGGKTTSRWQRWMCQLTTTPKKKKKEKKNLPLGNCLFQINNFCISSSSPCTPYQTIFNTRQSSILCLVLPVSSSCPLSFHGPPNTMAQLHPSNPTQPNHPKKKTWKEKGKKLKKNRRARQINHELVAKQPKTTWITTLRHH